ncbi:MAG: hypothetical protein F4103_15250 [Boseongicola sp. SB0673_bin_14]|nr:hypothetical protein [Boseongicola sp. SB0673_bin_14]
MAQTFDIVEEKLCEAHFFLEKLTASSPLSADSRYHFSAFVSAARSTTLSLQATMKTVPGFESWYASVQGEIRTDPLMSFFKEIRNDSIHTGRNPLNQVTAEHLREHLAFQLRHKSRSHVIVMPDLVGQDTTVLADAVRESRDYFKSVLRIVHDCYNRFRHVIDPQWHFTEENFIAMGKTFEDAVVELGYPPIWATLAPNEKDGWRVLRKKQPPCQINWLFQDYLGLWIPGPDDPVDEAEGA